MATSFPARLRARNTCPAPPAPSRSRISNPRSACGGSFLGNMESTLEDASLSEDENPWTGAWGQRTYPGIAHPVLLFEPARAPGPPGTLSRPPSLALARASPSPRMPDVPRLPVPPLPPPPRIALLVARDRTAQSRADGGFMNVR